MSDLATPRLALPLLSAGQAQKEMFHNEALLRLDLALHGIVAGVGIEIPPSAPVPGGCWILGAEPVGDWSGHAHEVAGWTGSGWRFLAPFEGMRFQRSDGVGDTVFTDGAWRQGAAHGPLIINNVQIVGGQLAPITEPSGGSVVDVEARFTILAVLVALREHGLIATV